MPVYETTANRGYQKPNLANQLSDDVGRLRSALDAIDGDMSSALVGSVIAETAYIVSQNVTLGSNRHGLSLTSVEIGSGYSVEVPAGATWTIAIL